MGTRDRDSLALSSAAGSVRHDDDVLVIGGGPAGAWAAIGAAATGAKVCWPTKGHCGASRHKARCWRECEGKALFDLLSRQLAGVVKQKNQ